MTDYGTISITISSIRFKDTYEFTNILPELILHLDENHTLIAIIIGSSGIVVGSELE